MASVHRPFLLTLATVFLASTPSIGVDPPATVATVQGDFLTGRFLGATNGELSVEVGTRTLKIPLRDVRYISFVGPLAVQPSAHAKPETAASRLRAAGLAEEQAGRLEQALAKYLEAARVDANDDLTTMALDRVRQTLAAQAAAAKAAPFKKLAVDLNDAGRYREAAACYDEAVRLDPADRKFKELLAPTRHYWQPSACPMKPAEPSQR